jgi:outer membrane protein assembly factor BamD
MKGKHWLVPLFVLLLAVAGCTAKKKLSADQYFTEATKDFEDGAFQLSIEEYRTMLDQFPFSDHTEEAELRIAQAHLMAGDLAEAVASFTDFQRRHPTSPHLPYVGYALGLCYARQMGTIDRDQTASQNAHNYFATVAQQYPDSPFAELAREQLAKCRESLAAHQLYIADFYAARDNSKAAEMRLLELVGRYQDTTAASDALFQLAQIYRKEDEPDRAVLADAALAQRFPHSKYGDLARRRLEKLGKQDLLVGADPMPLLLADLPQTSSDTLAAPVQVPGLDNQHRRPLAPGVPALAPPSPFGGSPGY